MKTIYKLTVAAIVSATTMSGFAQTPTSNSGSDNYETGLIEEIAHIKDKTDKFHLYLNTQANFNMNWDGENGENFEGGKFAFKQLRLEMKGNVNDWLSYRFRMRLNKGQSELGYFDNILKSIDIMEVGFRYKKVNFVVGKQCTAYGGIEFDLNPIEVYQYCDMIDYMDNFMTGVRAAWDITPAQQLQFQILNSTALNPGEMYGYHTPAKLPLLYTLNWNGNFNNFYSTRWSASFMNEIKDKHMWYFAMGNQFNFTPKWGAWLDVMYSREGIDRKGIITNVVGGQQPIAVPGPDGEPTVATHNAYNTEYFTMLLHTNYFIHPKWNIFAKVAWERNGVYKATEGYGNPGDIGDYQASIAKGTYGIDWLYVGGVEFYPLKDRGLHFFLTYVGQNTRHTQKAMEYGQPKSSYTNLLTCGFIWQIPVF